MIRSVITMKATAAPRGAATKPMARSLSSAVLMAASSSSTVSSLADVEEAPEVVTQEQSVEWKALYDLAEQAANDGLIPPESLGWAERLARGDTYEQIGADEGLPAATVRKRMERVRRILRERWREATGLTGAIIGAVLLFFWLRGPAAPAIVPEAYVPAPSASTAAAPTALWPSSCMSAGMSVAAGSSCPKASVTVSPARLPKPRP